jgi:hypothetical protein
VLVAGFGIAPAALPGDVLLIVVIMAASAMEVAGRIDFLVRMAERIIRKNPKQVTIVAPLVTYGFTFAAGTGHIVYPLLPVIYEVRTRTESARFEHFIRGIAFVKKAAAMANAELGVLQADKADAIGKACDEIEQGKLHDQFVIDMFQGGAGTSTNMNANEVIANRALEILGTQKENTNTFTRTTTLTVRNPRTTPTRRRSNSASCSHFAIHFPRSATSSHRSRRRRRDSRTC